MEAFFEAFGIDWRLMGIQTINFIVVVLVLTYFLYKPLMRVLDERARKVAEGLRAADASIKEHAAISASRTEVLATANHEATLIVARAEEAAAKEKVSLIQAAEARAAARRSGNDLIAAEVCERAFNSRICPSNVRTVITAAASK